MRIGRSGCLLNFCIACFQPTVPDIFADGAAEQVDILRNQANLRAKRLLGNGADINTINTNTALCNVVKNGGIRFIRVVFSRPGRTNKCE